LSFSFDKKGDAKLYIEVKGIEKIQGKIMVAVYLKEENFLNIAKSFKKYSFTVKSKVMTLALEGLLKDEYFAIAIYHDENNNDQLDKNMFGMPTEKYGFSNNARATFSAPSFESAKVLVRDCKKISVDIY